MQIAVWHTLRFPEPFSINEDTGMHLFPFSYFNYNLILTILVTLFVILLPTFDRKICAALGVNVEHSMTGSFREARLLRLRKFILYMIFLTYLAANVYVVFFSRSASEEYRIHVDPLNDLFNSVRIDSGMLGVLSEVYTQGLSEGFSHIHVDKPEDIAQIYMNIILYVPMGYLLPYVFEWCQAKARIRPVLVCLLFSFLTENLQLVFKRGFYDVDDLLSNTFGGLVGQSLYILFAYVADHPDWRKKLHDTRKWIRKARKHTLYPFASKIGLTRTTLVIGDRSLISDFYIHMLGFRPIAMAEDVEGCTCYMMQMGNLQLELRCWPGEDPGDQYLTIPVNNLAKVRKRLTQIGFDPEDFHSDPYTGLRCLTIEGPEKMHITFIQT